MSDPPRLRDLPGADDFTRGLLRDAPPTRGFTAADAARLQAAVTRAGAGTGSWFASGAFPKALAAVTLVLAGAGALRGTWHAAPPTSPLTHARPRASAAPPAVAARAVSPAPAVAPRPALAARAAPAVIAPVATPAAPALATPAPAPVASAPPVAPIAPAARVALAPAAALPALRLGGAPLAPPPAPAPPTLHDELRAIEQAQAALRGDPARAVEILDRAERSAVRPQLLDERDLLHIDALTRLGRWSEARARALALEARAPRSPQSARARALLRRAP